MYTQNEIMEKVEKFIQAEGSQNAACAKMGVSPSVISAVRKGNYTGNTEKIFAKLAEYFGVKSQAELTYTEIEYAETYISSQVYKIIRTAQIKGGLAVACGDAGIGKTKAIKKYIADHQNSICITVNPCLSSVKAILNMIADRIGVTNERLGVNRRHVPVDYLQSLPDSQDRKVFLFPVSTAFLLPPENTKARPPKKGGRVCFM